MNRPGTRMAYLRKDGENDKNWGQELGCNVTCKPLSYNQVFLVHRSSASPKHRQWGCCILRDYAMGGQILEGSVITRLSLRDIVKLLQQSWKLSNKIFPFELRTKGRRGRFAFI
ncbi:hypothetical protein VNO77_30972 [Canavalia gladiata]|uniref:Uncharacterized protein n=1 Tax=Canavalia gladiata TaxID=3824 RepID=A0AAN9KNW3_CANGL